MATYTVELFKQPTNAYPGKALLQPREGQEPEKGVTTVSLKVNKNHVMEISSYDSDHLAAYVKSMSRDGKCMDAHGTLSFERAMCYRSKA